MPDPLRIGVIGYGAIGRQVADALADGTIARAACSGILVRRDRPASDPHAAHLTSDPERFFAARPQVVVEVAGHQALRDYGERALRAGADLMVTSVGALTDDALNARLRSAAEATNRRILIPSAGVGALDILTAAAQGGLEAVRMTVIKDAQSWLGTVAERDHDLRALPGPTVLYDGAAREGARLYPQNVNIAAAVALAGVGLDRTQLRIVADPADIPHIVEIEARGHFGRFTFREEITPTMENRKTGRLVAMAVVKALRQLTATVVIGG
jgi:aspartate dehydrogenase